MRHFEDFSEKARERAWAHILSYSDAQGFLNFIEVRDSETPCL